jgi:hypothetical protein
MNAEDKQAAEVAIDQFQATYGAKYPKSVDKVLKDREVLLTHFDFPVEHWIHLRTTDEIVKPGEWRQAQELPMRTSFFFGRAGTCSSSGFNRGFHLAVKRRYSVSAITPAAWSC